jgi:hypothetical protein
VRLGDLEAYLAEQVVDPATIDLDDLAEADEG